MVRLGVLALGGVVAGLCALSEGRASLHHPEEPMAIPVNAKGEPEALPFDAFANRRAKLTNIANSNGPLEVEVPDPKDPNKKTKQKADRGVVKDRIDKLMKLPNRTQEQSVALAVDLLRFGRPDEADGALKGKQRQGYLGYVTLAHTAAAQANPNDLKTRDWGRALSFLSDANEVPPPKEFPGLTPQQLEWQVKLNREALLRFVRLRLEEARGKSAPENELPDAIFPVDFANVTGGALAPAEQAKLPPDALATVQQLVLWFPTDPRLYWLLAEIYAAKGEFAAAQKIMDECAWSLQYGNRKVFMQHREAVTKAAKEKGVTPDAPLVAPTDNPSPPDEPAVPFTMGAVWIYFSVVAAVALFALVRALTKRKKNNNGLPS